MGMWPGLKTQVPFSLVHDVVCRPLPRVRAIQSDAAPPGGALGAVVVQPTCGYKDLIELVISIAIAHRPVQGIRDCQS